MKSKFITLEKMRHSIYHLGANVQASPEEVTNLIEAAIKYAPTPFNNQTVRAVILLGKAQKNVWDVIAEGVKSAVGEQKFQKMAAPKIHSFKAGYGTVLFYTNNKIVRDTANQIGGFPSHNFVEWAEQAQGNAQYSVWTALAEQKIGASIHHYGSLFGKPVSEALAKKFGIPDDWKLRAEMAFGSIEKPGHSKTFIPDDKRFKVFK